MVRHRPYVSKIPERKCPHCGLFFKRVKSQVYCSMECAFWSRVDKRGEDECWPWTGATTLGYGNFNFLNVSYRANRVALMLSGFDMSEAHALHECDNRICCNPKHLHPGTHAENMREARDRCRIHPLRREKHHRAIVTEAEVKEIKSMLGVVRQVDIAEQFGVRRSLIADISAGRSWSD